MRNLMLQQCTITTLDKRKPQKWKQLQKFASCVLLFNTKKSIQKFGREIILISILLKIRERNKIMKIWRLWNLD